MLCLHFGPGQLGLGLIASTLVDAGQEVVLIGRPAGDGVIPERSRFGIASSAVGERLRYITVAGACNPSNFDDLPDDVRERIGTCEPVLITSALGSSAQSAMGLIDAIVARRPDGAETVLAACENDAAPCYRCLADRWRDRLVVCDCVVDRVCVARSGAERDSQGCRIVTVHPVNEWVIQDVIGAPSVILEMLERAGVNRVPMLAPWKDRKLWTVNGLHQILALVGRLDGVTWLDEAARRERFGAVARPFAAAIANVHAAVYPNFVPDRAYLDSRIRVFAEVLDDPVERIIGPYLVRQDLTGLISRLHARVFAVAKHAHEHGLDLGPFHIVVELLLDVLAREHLYYAPKPGAAVVPDELVIKMFTAAVSGWTSAAQRDQYVFRFRRTLALITL